MAGIADSFSSTTYIKMPQYGRIKEVYISAGQYIQDVMAEKGCIALLSLDGWMYVETDAVDGMEISSTVKVKVGRTTLDGTVRALENGKATVTFSDAYGTEGGEVELTFGKQTLGTGGRAHPHALPAYHHGEGLHIRRVHGGKRPQVGRQQDRLPD